MGLWDHVMDLWDHVRNKKPLHLYYFNAYRHQTWKDSDLLPLGAPTHNVKWTLDHVFLQDYMTNCNHYISTTAVPMAIKLGRMVT